MKTKLIMLSLIIGAVSWSAQATPYVVTLQQVGPNLVATGTGAIDLTGLTAGGGSLPFPQMSPDNALILTGAEANITFYSSISGPATFGPSGGGTANIGNGNIVGINGAAGLLFVPVGYTSDSPLSDNATYSNKTFSSFGVTPGTYVWTWGTGPDQSFTLQIGAVPDTGSTFGLLAVALAALFGASRFRSLRLA